MGVVFILVFAGIMFAVASAHKRHVESAWRDAALKLGLQVQTGGFFTRPTIVGRVGSIDVHVRTVNRGKNNVYTVYSVRFPARTRAFRLSREHVLSGFAKIFGAEDVQIGEHRFDSSFMVKAQDPTGLVTYLTPSRRIELLSYAATNKTVVVTESTIESTFRGTDTRSDRIVTRIRRIVSLAEQMSQDDPIHDRDEAFTRRLTGDLEDGARGLETAGRTRPADYGTRLAEIETKVAAEQLDAAKGRARELTEALPSDEQLEGWLREIDELTKEQAATRATTEAPESTPAGDLPSDTVIQDLFGTTKLSFETAERFRLHYKNRDVDWQGVVKSTRDFSSDPDFGSQPGVKAVVTIAEVEHDLYGNSTIDAVIHFPAGTHLQRNDVVTFTGRLTKIDPLMRNVYIANGALVDD